MKKSIIGYLAFIAIIITCAMAQEYKNRQPTPDEARWTAGIFDFTRQTNMAASNFAASNWPYRTLQVRIPTNTSSLTFTNSLLTSNSVIVFSPLIVTDYGGASNTLQISNVLYSNGSLTVRFGNVHTNPATNPVSLRMTILNY